MNAGSWMELCQSVQLKFADLGIQEDLCLGSPVDAGAMMSFVKMVQENMMRYDVI